MKLRIKSGDLVKVISGDDRVKGTTGKVLSVDTKKLRAIVEGVNIVTKHKKPDAKTPNGGIVKQEASVHISNLMLIDPKTGAPTRTGKKLDSDGELRRYSKKTNDFI